MRTSSSQCVHCRASNLVSSLSLLSSGMLMAVLASYPHSRSSKLVSMLSPLASGMLVVVRPSYAHRRAVKLISRCRYLLAKFAQGYRGY
ncbi:hypothetical protein V2W45_1366362 [Cenococcum geophilum]